jgi:AcrR family transcriptional regulator
MVTKKKIASIERRATSPDAKEARRQQIMAAADELLEGWSFADITMDRIADRGGVAKGTLYLYFRTKEALFLALYEDRLGAWYAELQTLADQGAGTVDPAAAARVIASTLSARPTLIHLHGLLHSNLGHNIDLETTVAFRRRQRQALASLAPALAARIEDLSEVPALRFLIRLEAVVGALSWAAFPPSLVKRALEEEDLKVFRIDFEEELREIVTALLRQGVRE